MANCSATTSEGWFGSITPPEPMRIRDVEAARWAISTGGEVLAIVGKLWCSATQNRWKPSSSARRASAVVSVSAVPVDEPSGTTARSSTDRRTRRPSPTRRRPVVESEAVIAVIPTADDSAVIPADDVGVELFTAIWLSTVSKPRP
jgi:hypothetical protein